MAMGTATPCMEPRVVYKAPRSTGDVACSDSGVNLLRSENVESTSNDVWSVSGFLVLP